MRAAVLQAFTDLTAERGYGNFAVSEVATSAGVADSSIYRRWKSLDELAMDVAVDWLTVRSPIPDTGSLEGDLRAYAAKAAQDVSGPDGPALLRVVIALSGGGETTRDRFLAGRADQVQEMLDRAKKRGEDPPDVLEVVDVILAPMYLRVLFGAGPLTPEYADGLVDRLLTR